MQELASSLQRSEDRNILYQGMLLEVQGFLEQMIIEGRTSSRLHDRFGRLEKMLALPVSVSAALCNSSLLKN